MQKQRPFKSSIKPQDLNIPAEIINTIKNSELRYEFKSEFYINVPEKSQLNIILFLCLYDSGKTSIKKVISTLSAINKAELNELNEEYFNARNLDDKNLNLPSQLEKSAIKFNYHEKLIISLAPIFQKMNNFSLLDHPVYKNKVQMRQFSANKLAPFNKIPFNAINQVKNDIIIIPSPKGYYIACYSTEKQSQNRDSFKKKQDIKAQPMKKQQIKEEDVLEEEELKLFIKEEQEKKKKQEESKAKKQQPKIEKKQSKQKLLKPTEEVKSVKKEKEDRNELYSIIALGIIFLFILYEAAPIFLK